MCMCVCVCLVMLLIYFKVWMYCNFIFKCSLPSIIHTYIHSLLCRRHFYPLSLCLAKFTLTQPTHSHLTTFNPSFKCYTVRTSNWSVGRLGTHIAKQDRFRFARRGERIKLHRISEIIIVL